jgi:hypothetical protein
MPIALRADYDAARLRAFARKTKDGPQARRLLALAAIYDGATRTQAARIGGVTLQIVRDWVVKFNGSGPGWSHRPQGARATLEVERRAPGGPRQDDRERPDPSAPWGSAVAARRPVPVGLRGVPNHGVDADPEP